MDTLQHYIVRQNVNLANGENRWIDVGSDAKESNAWRIFNKYKSEGHKVVIVKLSETVIAK